MRSFIFSLLATIFLSLDSEAHFHHSLASLEAKFTENNGSTAGKWNVFDKFAGCKLGDNTSGLAEIKKYFWQFGYMAPNSTDIFDHAMESAVKTYQKHFHLKQTGVLDSRTLREMKRPRCGNADLVHADAATSVAHYTFFPGKPRWPDNKRRLTYAFLAENHLDESTKKVFAKAFSSWSEVTRINFSRIESYNHADIRIGFVVGSHGDGVPFDGEHGILAHSFAPPAGFLHLDSDEDWVVEVKTDEFPFPVTDLESVVLHEIGHLLGLGHSSVKNSVMFPTLPSGTKKVKLHPDDIKGVQSLYGVNPRFNATVYSRAYSSAAFLHLSLFGVFFVFL